MTSRTGPANDPKDKRPVKGESSKPVNSRLIPPQPEGWGLGDGVVVDGKNTRAQRREAERTSPKEGGWKPPGNVARTASAEARKKAVPMSRNKSSDVGESLDRPEKGGDQTEAGPPPLPSLDRSEQDGGRLNEDKDRLDKTSNDLLLDKELDITSPEYTGSKDVVSTPDIHTSDVSANEINDMLTSEGKEGSPPMDTFEDANSWENTGNKSGYKSGSDKSETRRSGEQISQAFHFRSSKEFPVEDVEPNNQFDDESERQTKGNEIDRTIAHPDPPDWRKFKDPKGLLVRRKFQGEGAWSDTDNMQLMK